METISTSSPIRAFHALYFLARRTAAVPSADNWVGRLSRVLVGHRTPEVQSLHQFVNDNPNAIQEELRDAFLQGTINIISSLQTVRPIVVKANR